MSRTLAQLGEEGLLHLLTASWKTDRRVQVGVGDDCAVLPGRTKHHCWLFKTDAVVENVHFTARTPARLVGRKALARALSDVAAMGGRPVAALITLGLPRTASVRRVQEIYRGLTALARIYGVNLAGGETTRAREMMMSVALLGETVGHSPILRRTARRGDLIWVTGTLGGTQKKKHLTFTPRLQEGQWLARPGRATAMMDVSDGLSQDLPRLAHASGLGFRLEFSQLPRRRGVTESQALQDGEDYELLFTTRPEMARVLPRVWPFATGLTCVGEMVTGRARMKAGGYDHFAQ